MKTRFPAIICTLLSLTLMCSCMVMRRQQGPDLRLPAQIAAGQTDSLTFADLTWWEVYADTTLQGLIRRTLTHNKDMQVAAERIEEMAALRRIRTAALLPELSAGVAAERERENYRGNGAANDDEFGVKARLNWEIDLWGNLRWGRRQGIAEYLASVEAAQAMRMTLIAEVAQAYYELVALDNELSIVRRTLETRKEGVRQAQLRFEGGLTSETSYQQAQVELATTATLIPELERRIAVKEHEIALLAGEYPRRIAREALDPTEAMPERLPVGLPSELLLRRPDVREAEQALRAAYAAVGVAYTDRFPRIQLSAAFGVENDLLASLFSSPYSFISGTIAGPIFGFGKKRARYKAQQAAYQQECRRYEQTVLTVFKEVCDAMVSYDSSLRASQLKRNLERAARSYVELARLQYLNGVINYLDVLDAQRRYFDAQIGLSNALRDQRLARVQLYKALGGGWQDPDSTSIGHLDRTVATTR